MCSIYSITCKLASISRRPSGATRRMKLKTVVCRERKTLLGEAHQTKYLKHKLPRCCKYAPPRSSVFFIDARQTPHEQHTSRVLFTPRPAAIDSRLLCSLTFRFLAPLSALFSSRKCITSRPDEAAATCMPVFPWRSVDSTSSPRSSLVCNRSMSPSAQALTKCSRCVRRKDGRVCQRC